MLRGASGWDSGQPPTPMTSKTPCEAAEGPQLLAATARAAQRSAKVKELRQHRAAAAPRLPRTEVCWDCLQSWLVSQQ